MHGKRTIVEPAHLLTAQEVIQRVELGNVCCRNLEHLHEEIIRARERLRHKQEVIRSGSMYCSYQTALVERCHRWSVALKDGAPQGGPG